MIAMRQRKATDQPNRLAEKSDNSTDFFFYESYRTDRKIKKISSTKIGKKPIYRFFLDFDNRYFP